MAKARVIVAEPLPGEFGSLTWPEFQALPAEVRLRRAQRGYERFLALKGQVQLNIDIDELRGRNRR